MLSKRAERVVAIATPRLYDVCIPCMYLTDTLGVLSTEAVLTKGGCPSFDSMPISALRSRLALATLEGEPAHLPSPAPIEP